MVAQGIQDMPLNVWGASGEMTKKLQLYNWEGREALRKC